MSSAEHPRLVSAHSGIEVWEISEDPHVYAARVAGRQVGECGHTPAEVRRAARAAIAKAQK